MRPYYLDFLEKRVATKDLLRELIRRLGRKISGGKRGAGRQIWTPGDVVDADGPELSLRSYLEHRDIRRMLDEIPEERRGVGMEVACGFARLTPVLEEYFKTVHAVEREPELLEIARTLAPGIRYHRVERLTNLLQIPGPVDFAMVFTVLMHMTDQDAREVLKAMREKVGRGWILVVERTDSGPTLGNSSDSTSFMDHGRSVAVFEEWLLPFKLVKSMQRSIEPTYHRKDNGTYMLFCNA
jgi:hypothetical protein